MKTYKVLLHISQIINADSKDEALEIFWDDLHINQEGQELATVELLRKGKHGKKSKK